MRKGDLLVTTKVDIPAQNQPYRRQASLGGSVSYRNINANEDMSYIVLAKVTKVYYKQGRIDYTLVNRADIVQGIGSNGNGSAPIPLDFFGYQPNGNPYGQYRPIQIGNLITLAFLNGHMSAPIVLGVYPNNPDIYNALSPATYTEGDDRNSDVADDVLACQEVYPSGQLEYRSGSGAILKALNGHSYMAIDDDSIKNNYDELWSTYDKVYDFYRQGTLIEPQKEKAGQWLLVHEDNPLAEDSDNHLTRFYVNPKGEFQIALMNNTFEGNTLLLNGSKDDGFTIEKYYNHDSKADVNGGHGAGHTEEYRLPDYDTAEKYVKLNLGGKDGFKIESSSKAESKEQASSLQITENGIFINGKALTDAMNTGDQKGSIINDAVKDSPDLKKAIDTAKQAASDASEVGVDARKASAQVQSNINDMKANMRNYLAQSADDDYKSKSDEEQGNLWAQVFDHAYIKDGGAIHFVADTLDAGTLRGTNMKFENVRFTEGAGNHISANIIDTGELNAGIIKAGTIEAEKIDSPELSDITKRLGDIEAGSIKIGKVDGNGNAIDPIKSDTVNSGEKVAEFDSPKSAPIPVKIATLDTTFWQQVAGKQVNISADVTVTNYQEPYVNTDGIASGIKIELTDGNNITHTFSGDIDNVHLPIYDPKKDTKDITTKQQITIKVDVPDTITRGSSKAYGNLKADRIVIDNLKTNYSNPKYDTAKDAFSVDSDGNVIARSFTAENGKIIGGEIQGNSIHNADYSFNPFMDTINNNGRLTSTNTTEQPSSGIMPDGTIYANSTTFNHLAITREQLSYRGGTQSAYPDLYYDPPTTSGSTGDYSFGMKVLSANQGSDSLMWYGELGRFSNLVKIPQKDRVLKLVLYMSLEYYQSDSSTDFHFDGMLSPQQIRVIALNDKFIDNEDFIKKDGHDLIGLQSFPMTEDKLNEYVINESSENIILYNKYWRKVTVRLDLRDYKGDLDKISIGVLTSQDTQNTYSIYGKDVEILFPTYWTKIFSDTVKDKKSLNNLAVHGMDQVNTQNVLLRSDGSLEQNFISPSFGNSEYDSANVEEHLLIDRGAITLQSQDQRDLFNRLDISASGISFSPCDVNRIGTLEDTKLSFGGTDGKNGFWFDSYGNMHGQAGAVFRIYSEEKGGSVEVFHVNLGTGKFWVKNGQE